MKTVKFNPDSLYELIGYIISYGIDCENQSIIDAARKIEYEILDDCSEDFLNNAKINGCDFELNY